MNNSLEGFFDYNNKSANKNIINADKMFYKNMKDYGLEVLEERALADYRDGLKPAQRRLLWTAKELNANWNNKTVKSARITGDCMGKYHPHSTSYGSLVNMATSEYPIIYGEGNFGSLTDSAAAERYTEAKISELGMKMLECMDVAEYVPNYTGEFKEPIVITTRLPNYFINECAGIAVGISCNIPSHNLEEVVNALKIIIKKGRNTTIKDIMKYIKGPDYKYGGKILSTSEEIANLYENGEGSIKYECDYTLVREKKNYLLTITGYCPGFNPNSFITKMISLIDSGIVISVNDSSTKNEPCKLEVIIKSEEDFENKIHKHLQKQESYRYYAIERQKSNNIDKDINTEIISENLIELMNRWIDWRKDIETKMCIKEKEIYEDKVKKSNWKLIASQNLKIIMKALENENPFKFIMENLPGIKNTHNSKDAAKYILEQKIISLQKIDQNKITNDINTYTKQISILNNNIEHIENIIIKELDNLKSHFKPRKLKI